MESTVRTVDDGEHVRDHEGHIWWRVRVAPGERTCYQCGETFPEGDRCALCGYGDDGQHRHNPPPSVPTISYLNEGEWE